MNLKSVHYKMQRCELILFEPVLDLVYAPELVGAIFQAFNLDHTGPLKASGAAPLRSRQYIHMAMQILLCPIRLLISSPWHRGGLRA